MSHKPKGKSFRNPNCNITRVRCTCSQDVITLVSTTSLKNLSHLKVIPLSWNTNLYIHKMESCETL
jgi:hypothetical protein